MQKFRLEAIIIKKIGQKVKDNLKSSFITLNENIQRFLALMQMNFKMQKFRLEAMIIDKLSQKIKMLVAN